MGFQLEPPMAWIIILVIMVLIEVFTLGLTTIWFAGGALAAFVVSIAGGRVPAQVIVFLIVSLILLLLIRPLAKTRFNSKRVGPMRNR
ncbi:MAG: hypothetical protein V8R80_09710 [Eubacterium sp.]